MPFHCAPVEQLFDLQATLSNGVHGQAPTVKRRKTMKSWVMRLQASSFLASHVRFVSVYDDEHRAELSSTTCESKRAGLVPKKQRAHEIRNVDKQQFAAWACWKSLENGIRCCVVKPNKRRVTTGVARGSVTVEESSNVAPVSKTGD